MEMRGGNNQMRFEILRLVTPLMMGILGTMCYMELTRVETTLQSSNDKIQVLSADISGLRANTQSIEERLIRDETIYDKRGFR